MASARMTIDSTKNLAQRLQDVMNFGALFREKLGELNNVTGKFGNDPTAWTAATGMSSSDYTTFQALLANAVAEMSALTNVQVAAGGQTNVRQLLDAISTIG